MTALVYKFQLLAEPLQAIKMHASAELLCVGEQDGVPMLWAKIDTDQPILERRIAIVGTARPIEQPIQAYVGTVSLHFGKAVLHVFDCGEQREIQIVQLHQH